VNISGLFVSLESIAFLPLAKTHVEINGRRIPLEADTSLALAEFYASGSKFYGMLNMLIEPLPFVRETIFLGAPHQGAHMANQTSGSLGKGMMSRPEYIRSFLEAKEGREEKLLSQANGIANLAPDSLFSQALSNSVWNPALPVHSIIGDLWTAANIDGAPEGESKSYFAQAPALS